MHKPNLRESFWRSLLTFDITRVLIAVVLLVYLIANKKSGVSDAEQWVNWQICVVYLALAMLFAVFAVYYRGRFVLQSLLQITVDVLAISLLYVAAGGTRSGLAILYLFPLAGGAVLLPEVWALFFAAAVTLFLLGESGYRIFVLLADGSFSQAGLYGAAFFSSVFLVNRLAARLINQEDLALERGKALQMQESINRMVIADMGDGILVVGRDGTVQIGNPAAERMLGMTIPAAGPHFRLADVPVLVPIADAFFEWMSKTAEQRLTEAAAFIVIRPGEDASLGAPSGAGVLWGWRREPSVHLKLRFAAVPAMDMEGERTVIFLQDVTEIENRAQQLKLASMGRLTASIAHEVRNPLSAISYAASLLSEDMADATPRRLLNIIGDNVTRLNRMIEDILKLSRRAQSHNEPLALTSFFQDIQAELQETRVLPDSVLRLSEMDGQCVRFDPLHLREVMMNLLTNAVRYASGRPGSIRVHPVFDGTRLELHVQDDGPAISPEVRAHLFEPFYTTSSKGTGLGLYVARELCLNNGAMLDYEYRLERSEEGVDEARGRFVITFAAAEQST
ncbi:MAG: two-component sensor histidine kinase [Burkholderiaceae bacterium]|nr:two-component sensor histidine kinase [Burkholderiaceae bacterium]